MRARRIAAGIIAAALMVTVAQGKANPRAKRNEAWRAGIRTALHVPEQMPALEMKVWSEFEPASGVMAERVTYATADGMLVPAVVYRPNPEPKRRLPGIVIVNGHGSDKYGWYSYWSGVEFARAGAVVVTYDMIGEGERNGERRSQAGAHDKLPLEYGTRLTGLMLTDLMQAVTLLRERRDVDAKRIAVAGYSMGSFVAAIAGAIDLRIHAVVLSGAGVFDGAGGYYDTNKLPCQRPAYRALAFVVGAEERGPALMALNAERGPTLVMNGEQDTVMDLPHHDRAWFNGLRARTIALNGGERNVFTTVFYPGISHRTSWVNRDGFLWLEEQIHFGIWTRAQIEAMGETHISEWAKANGVLIAPSYMREDREGGLMAVGGDVPGLTRAQLTVLPEAEWERLKNQLTYDAWAAKVMKQYPPEPVADIVLAIEQLPKEK